MRCDRTLSAARNGVAVPAGDRPPSPVPVDEPGSRPISVRNPPGYKSTSRQRRETPWGKRTGSCRENHRSRPARRASSSTGQAAIHRRRRRRDEPRGPGRRPDSCDARGRDLRSTPTTRIACKRLSRSGIGPLTEPIPSARRGPQARRAGFPLTRRFRRFAQWDWRCPRFRLLRVNGRLDTAGSVAGDAVPRRLAGRDVRLLGVIGGHLQGRAECVGVAQRDVPIGHVLVRRRHADCATTGRRRPAPPSGGARVGRIARRRRRCPTASGCQYYPRRTPLSASPPCP